PPASPLFPYTTLFRSRLRRRLPERAAEQLAGRQFRQVLHDVELADLLGAPEPPLAERLETLDEFLLAALAAGLADDEAHRPFAEDRKSTRLNSSHVKI